MTIAEIEAEIIEEIGLGHRCFVGDLIDGRSTKAVGGKYFQRRIKDNAAIDLLNTGRLVARIFLPLHRLSHAHFLHGLTAFLALERFLF